MNLSLRLAGAASASALILSMITPAAFAATNVVITGNGAKSFNSVSVKNKNGTVVNQSNNTAVFTGVSSSAKTGGNSASYNTGGNSSVTTGNATSVVGVTVGGSTNSATVSNCGCEADTTVVISDNGHRSFNNASVKNGNWLTVDQSNSTLVETEVWSSVSTGWNKANHNTNGDSTIDTGAATSAVTVDVSASSNTLNP